MKIIVLTDAEYNALDSVIINGTRDNEYKDFGTSQHGTYCSALRKFAKPLTTFRQIEKLEGDRVIKKVIRKVLSNH